MGRAPSASVWGSQWKTEVLRALPEWSDFRQPKDGRISGVASETLRQCN